MSDIKKKIGKYEIVSILGKGAMGVVYKARDPIIDRLVAIKTQHLNIPDAQILRLDERFITEARAVGRLSHPNIVGLYDFGQDDDCSYIVMELASGFQLTEFVSRKQPITIDEIWDTILKILDGIQYAHECNVIHRDIKPANIIRDGSGNVKITDFGIAQVDTSSLTNTGHVIGTPRYMAPERIKGEKADFRADIFSCGVVLHELLTGQLAFHDKNSATVIYKITNTELPPASQLCSDCPEEMDAVIAKAIAKDPEERFISARDFADEIKKVLEQSKSAVIDTEQNVTESQAPPANLQVDLPASTQESELQPPVANSNLAESNVTNDTSGSGKRFWILLIIILAVGFVVFLFLQVFKENSAGGDSAPVDKPTKPPEEVVSTREFEPAILPTVKTETRKRPARKVEAFSKITIGAMFSDCPDCPSMIVVPSGKRLLGSTQNKGGQAAYMVEIAQPFAVAQFEVSRGEFAEFVSATGYDANGCLSYENNEWIYQQQRNWQSPGYDQDDTHPVVCISWVDANKYVKWISGLTGKQYRLLSSSEWEYLARGGYGESEKINDSLRNICQFANVADTSALKNYPGWIVHDCEDLYVHTSPVNISQFEANYFGVSGLLGNAFEWVSDCWTEGNNDIPADGTARLTDDCAKRVLRGGSWFSQPDYVKFGFQNRFDGDIRASTFGFRIARGLDPEETIPTGGEPDL